LATESATHLDNNCATRITNRWDKFKAIKGWWVILSNEVLIKIFFFFISCRQIISHFVSMILLRMANSFIWELIPRMFQQRIFHWLLLFLMYVSINKSRKVDDYKFCRANPCENRLETHHNNIKHLGPTHTHILVLLCVAVRGDFVLLVLSLLLCWVL
jgi:hypothetical protein